MSVPREDLAAAMARARKATKTATRRPAVPALSTPPVPKPRPLLEDMSREARGDAPVWRREPDPFPRSVPFKVDEHRYRELRRLAAELGTSGAILLRAMVDALAEDPELVERLRPGIEEETRVLRRRRQS